MLALIGIVISIAAADAVNPSTLIPALYIASGENAFWRVLQFGLGVLAVTVSCGLIILLGPGELILDAVPKPTPEVTDWLQTAAGILLMLAAGVVFLLRGRLQRRSGSDHAPSQRPAALLGAGIAAVGFPTNVVYLGALATIIDSGQSVPRQLLALAVYDAVFILPMATIIAVLGLLPGRSTQILGGMRRLLEERFVPALIGVLLVAGAVVLALGVTGLAGRG